MAYEDNTLKKQYCLGTIWCDSSFDLSFFLLHSADDVNPTFEKFNADPWWQLITSKALWK